MSKVEAEESASEGSEEGSEEVGETEEGKPMCPDCKKVFSRDQRLDTHLSKDIPCSKKCRVCFLKLPTTAAYKRHLRQSHRPEYNQMMGKKEAARIAKEKKQKKKVTLKRMTKPKKVEPPKEKEEQPLELVPVRAGRGDAQDIIEYIPIEDFNWKYLESISDNVENARTFYQKVSLEGDNIQRVRRYEEITSMKINAQKAAESIAEAIRGQVLKGLEGTFDIADLAMNIMTSVHAERSRPHLITLRAKDMARGTMDIYSRPPPTNTCHWKKHTRPFGMPIVRQHCMDLFMFVMQISINMLIPVRLDCLHDPSVFEVGFTMPSTSQKQSVITFNKDLTEIIVSMIDKDKLEPPKMEYDAEDLDHLTYRIKERQQELNEQLNEVEIPEQRFRNFLEHAKNASAGYEIS